MSTKQKKESKKQRDERSSQERLVHIVDLFWGNNPYVRDMTKNNELEVRFGTMGKKTYSKIDYDNVVKKLKSLGFESSNEEGNYMLRINNEFLDPATGTFRQSNVRTEIIGFHGIQEYCKHNDINKMLASYSSSYEINFYSKYPYKHGDDRVYPVDFKDFNFRVSYDVEEKLRESTGKVKHMLAGWEKTKKTFRFINRVTFTHSELPINIDISIVKSSPYDDKTRRLMTAYTTEESGVFASPEVYEFELEVDNTRIGPSSLVTDAAQLLASIRKAIKYILMGLQSTNYPISYTEQFQVLQDYNKMIMGKDYDPEKHRRAKFIGPDSYTLQIANIAPINEDTIIPNIRNDYTVTDKADGERYMMFISQTGKIYFINKNLQVLFSGAMTENTEVFNSLMDGELILHDKYGKFINLYAAFDLYIRNGVDVRAMGFVPRKKEDNPAQFRLTIMKQLIASLKLKSVVPNEKAPIRVESKKFYPTRAEDDIFSACNYILGKEKESLYEYNTDGLIFTPASMGVGSDRIGVAGPLKKIVWEHSFKWKPPQYNTIDFLVKTVKTSGGTDQITPIFQEGIDASKNVQISEYKTLVLCVGFNPNQHGYINPCQDVIEDKLPNFKEIDDEDKYVSAEFVPTNPADPNAGICNIMLKRDATGVNQMFTEEEEVFEDDTIVEFRYDIGKDSKWRWVPLRVRYDKTAKYRQTGTDIGNAYHVANSNWHSIHNPITSYMISTGTNIPDELADDDVYYNRVTGATKTRGMRDFHNLFVKNLLITSVSKRGDTLIDYACGKGGDFSKWIHAQLSFVFGIDVSKDNLENRLDGACARFLNYRKKFKQVPYALFVNGDSGKNIRSGNAMVSDKAIQITKAVFGEGPKDAEKLGEGVYRQYGKGKDGFNISSCQFALHYFFKSAGILQNYVRNVSECTKVGGYFIGACYDGKSIFNLLENVKRDESITLYETGTKIWEVKKLYDNDEFNDDISSVDYEIEVYQESINKPFSEYLVNFDYLNRVMENYGFKLVTRDEAKDLGMPDGTGLFGELYAVMEEQIKRNRYKAQEYGEAMKMSANERKVSFLNRYFIYKKIRNVNAEKVSLEIIDEDDRDMLTEVALDKQEAVEPVVEEKKTKKKSASTKTKEPKSSKTGSRSRVKKLSNMILLDDSNSGNTGEKEQKQPEVEKEKEDIEENIVIETEALEMPNELVEEEEVKVEEVEKPVKKKRGRPKKQEGETTTKPKKTTKKKLVLDEE